MIDIDKFLAKLENEITRNSLISIKSLKTVLRKLASLLADVQLIVILLRLSVLNLDSTAKKNAK